MRFHRSWSLHFTRHPTMYRCKSKVRIVHSIPQLCMALSMYAIVVCIVSGRDGGISHNGLNTNMVFGFARMGIISSPIKWFLSELNCFSQATSVFGLCKTSGKVSHIRKRRHCLFEIWWVQFFRASVVLTLLKVLRQAK